MNITIPHYEPLTQSNTGLQDYTQTKYIKLLCQNLNQFTNVITSYENLSDVVSSDNVNDIKKLIHFLKIVRGLCSDGLKDYHKKKNTDVNNTSDISTQNPTKKSITLKEQHEKYLFNNSESTVNVRSIHIPREDKINKDTDVSDKFLTSTIDELLSVRESSFDYQVNTLLNSKSGIHLSNPTNIKNITNDKLDKKRKRDINELTDHQDKIQRSSNKLHHDRSHRDRSYGDRSYSDRSHSDRSHRDRSHKTNYDKSVGYLSAINRQLYLYNAGFNSNKYKTEKCIHGLSCRHAKTNNCFFWHDGDPETYLRTK